MGESSATEQRWYRKAFGRPRVVNGSAYLALGALWFSVTAGPGAARPWTFILGGSWLLLGVTTLIVVMRDRRLGRGSYAPVRTVAATGEDEPRSPRLGQE